MNFNGTRQLNAPRSEVWRLLNDVETLRQCIPGCETLSLIDVSTYEAVVAASVGPVRARFKGQLKRSDVMEPTSFTLDGEGQGGIAGFGKMNARVVLEEVGDGTLLKFDSEASVGGKLAQVGSRLVAVAAEKFNSQFFDRLEALIAKSSPSALEALPQSEPAPARSDVPVAPNGSHRFYTLITSWLKKRLLTTQADALGHLAVQRFVAESEIERLLNCYCHLIDTQAFDRLGELFTPNGELDLTGAPVTSPDAIAGFMRGRAKARTLHIPAGYIIRFISDSEALVDSSVLVFRGGADGAAPPFVSTAPGAVATYSDCVQFVSGSWRIHSRKAHLFMVEAST
jgi:uncharacterized protein